MAGASFTLHAAGKPKDLTVPSSLMVNADTRKATMRSLLYTLPAVLAGLIATAAPASARDMIQDCFGDDSPRRIEGCTELLEVPGLGTADKSLAYAMRALGYSLKGEYDLALPDYDLAISLDPASAVALNNRAWTLFKSGKAAQGLADVERSLQIDPASAHAFDTRAHIHQAMGEPRKALTDYTRAMQFGGKRIVKLYQCGLRSQGLFPGEPDGYFTTEMRRALEACVFKSGCDPLPPSEDCNYTTS